MEHCQVTCVHYLEDSDDEVFLSELLFETEKVKLKIVHHTNVDSLIAALKDKKPTDPKLVMVDLNMPQIKGTEAIKLVRSSCETDNLYIGICSGSEDPADKLSAGKVGARFFVYKPLDARSVQDACDTCKGLQFIEQEDGSKIVISDPSKVE